MRHYLILILFLLSMPSCKKEDVEKNELPPITQAGKNTFGCYVNGQLWVPAVQHPFERKITPVFGTWIRLDVQRYLTKDASDLQFLKLFMNPEESNTTQKLLIPENAGISYENHISNCLYIGEEGDRAEGYVTVTKFSLTEKILAGTFEITIYKNNCETLKFTEGRFDIKLP
jgi:hypothetical protein